MGFVQLTTTRNKIIVLSLGIIGLVTTFLLIRNPGNELATLPFIPDNEVLNPAPPEPEKPSFDAEKLSKALTTWGNQQTGEYSVVITDESGEVLAEENPDKVYFAASLYKVYVAYEGYRAVDAGKMNPDETYVAGHTRWQCLDRMIRLSDSVCSEPMWNELGKQAVTEKLKTYGLTNTSMSAITTSASDAARMHARIARGEGLSEKSQTAFLASMKSQIFRDGLNTGFGDNAVVYNKVGFRGEVEYHDVALVELPYGRKLIVSVLTEKVGTEQIAKLGTELYKVL